eukprot:3154191-Rhodomonas_salina.2
MVLGDITVNSADTYKRTPLHVAGQTAFLCGQTCALCGQILPLARSKRRADCGCSVLGGADSAGQSAARPQVRVASYCMLLRAVRYWAGVLCYTRCGTGRAYGAAQCGVLR